MKSSLRSFIGSRPGLFYPFYRLTRRAAGTRVLLFDAGTELVIEGFPRCGNTFAVLALQQAQPRPIAIAHHLHHPAQVLRGVKRGVPTVVLIRQPAAAVRSLALRRPEVSVGSLIRQYLDFYTPLLGVREGFYLADFAQVTADFGAVTRGINQRFATDFACFNHTAENVDQVFVDIDRINTALGGDEYQVSRPSRERETADEYAFTSAENRLLAKAEALYAKLRAASM